MKGIEKARVGVIAVAVVMLESVVRRLMGTRRLSSGVMMLAAAGMVLLVAAGGASANGACIGDVTGTVFGPGSTVTESCTFNDTMTCTGSGLIIGAGDITIDGNNFGITGSNAAWSYGIHNYEQFQYSGYDNVAIKNLDISGFQEGICIQGTSSGPHATKVENNMIYNCEVHDNGATTDELNSGYGIHFYDNVWYSTIDNCKVYNTIATISTSCDSSGAGIRIYGSSCHNSVTNCEVYGNALAGIYSKMMCEYNLASNNNVYNNAAPGTGSSFPGGIRLQCIRTNHWTVKSNNVWGNYGPGIFVGGQNNAIDNNDVTGSKNCTTTGDGSRGDGIIIDRSDNAEGGTYNTLTSNVVCDNDGYDIFVQPDKVGNTYNDNTCDNFNIADACDWSCAGDPQLCTNPDPPSHDFGSVQQGETRTWTFDVTNCGGGTLDWTVSDDQSWITVSPASGSATTETDAATVTIDTTGLADGAHNGAVTVSSNDGTKTGTISVIIPSGQADPQLCTNPDPPSHDFGSVQQGETRTWTFDVTNCGGGTLDWTVSDDQSWITVSQASGSATTETDAATVTIDTTGLADGAHNGAVTVSSNDGTKIGAIYVHVKTSLPPPPAEPMDVPALTPMGVLTMVSLLGIVAVSSIRRGKSE